MHLRCHKYLHYPFFGNDVVAVLHLVMTVECPKPIRRSSLEPRFDFYDMVITHIVRPS
ncbi:hypothetical protein D3C86_1337440 [compost metagenome]